VHAAITERVSVSTAGEEASGPSQWPALSADGRYVGFLSTAPDLVPGDTNGVMDVFVRDRLLGVTERVNVSTSGDEANDASQWRPGLSTDGRYVAFESFASNLGVYGSSGDVFVRDRLLSTTECASVGMGGEGNGQSFQAAISGDGRYVGFKSLASNLVEADTNDDYDVFVRDRVLGITERVSISSAGEEADDGLSGLAGSGNPAISADGRYVAFISWAVNLVPGDTNATGDVFVRDRLLGTTELVSIDTAGEQGNGWSGHPAISADGQYVAFVSYASNLVPGDTNEIADVFVHDRVAGVTERVTVSTTWEQANGSSSWPAITAGGRYVAFESSASNLVAGDANASDDVFVRDRLLETTERASVSTLGDEGAGTSCWADISDDGRYVVFESAGANLVPGDTNGSPDVYVHGPAELADVLPGFWAYEEVMACVDANVVKGYGDGLYHPEYEVTRDQMAVYIARALVSPSGDAAIPDPGPPPSFSDVSPDHWAYRHIEYAVSQGVVQGYEDGTYQPGVTVDRGQMAAFIARAMLGGDANVPNPGCSDDAPVFPDITCDFWARKYIQYLKGYGVTGGYEDGLYHPEDIVTRDQMAVYVARAFGL
jgi:Tol biopolymer transport system component